MPSAPLPPHRVKLLTYNVRRCLGTDGTLSPARIAAVIAQTGAEIIALQELDVGRPRSGGVDQAEAIAAELGMRVHFNAALTVLEERYGDALLTPRPSRLVKAGPLPGLAAKPHLEPRGALWAAVDLGEGSELQVIVTHLGLRSAERQAQAAALLGPDWLGHPDCRDPAVLLGDFNAVPGGQTFRRLAGALADLRRAPGIAGSPATFPSRFPLLRLDHVFARGPVRPLSLAAVRTPLARIASDHLPLLVEVEVERAVARVARHAAA